MSVTSNILASRPVTAVHALMGRARQIAGYSPLAFKGKNLNCFRKRNAEAEAYARRLREAWDDASRNRAEEETRIESENQATIRVLVAMLIGAQEQPTPAF